MKKKVTIKSEPHPTVLPTYQELAALVDELTVLYVAGVDLPPPSKPFISCRTPSGIPEWWQRAIDAREALIEHRVIERKERTDDA